VTLNDFNDSLRAVALADGVDLPVGARLRSIGECLSASVAREWDCGMAVYLQEETGEARFPTPIVPKLAENVQWYRRKYPIQTWKRWAG
jgi:hypothetical protein